MLWSLLLSFFFYPFILQRHTHTHTHWKVDTRGDARGTAERQAGVLRLHIIIIIIIFRCLFPIVVSVLPPE